VSALSPLQRGLVQQLDEADEYVSVIAGPPPVDEADRWIRVRDLTRDSRVVDAALASATAVCGGVRDAGAAYLSGWVADLIVGKAYGAMASTARTWVLDPERMWMRRHPEGWFDGFAIGDVPVRVLTSDPAATDHDARVVASDDPDELANALAADAVALLTPVFAVIRPRASIGTRGMWGMAADGVIAGAAYEALRAGRDEREAIERARVFVDSLVAIGGLPVTRPTTLTIPCAVRDVLVVQKGTCCLWYKVPDVTTRETTDVTVADEAEPTNGAHYCLSCPLPDEALQLPKWREWLEAEHPHLTPTG